MGCVLYNWLQVIIDNTLFDKIQNNSIEQAAVASYGEYFSLF